MKLRTAYVEITNQCNLNCRTCYNRSGLNRSRQEISYEALDGLIETFRPLGLQRLLFSGGEPTLHSDFDRILTLLDKHPDLSFGIVTNGTNPHRGLIERLNTNDRFTLQISLDGSSEERNAQTRGAGHFDQAMAFARQIHTPAAPPRLKMVVAQRNFDDIEAFYRLALSIGFVPEFAFLYRSGNAKDTWEEQALLPLQKLKTLKTVDRLNHETGMQAFLPMCTSRCPIPYTLDELSVCVKPNGDIQPCQSLYSEDYTIGNLFSFDEAALRGNLARIQSLAQQRTTVDYGCARCPLQQGCGRGCMAAAVNLCGDPLGDDGECAYRKMPFFRYQLPVMQKNEPKETR